MASSSGVFWAFILLYFHSPIFSSLFASLLLFPEDCCSSQVIPQRKDSDSIPSVLPSIWQEKQEDMCIKVYLCSSQQSGQQQQQQQKSCISKNWSFSYINLLHSACTMWVKIFRKKWDVNLSQWASTIHCWCWFNQNPDSHAEGQAPPDPAI